MAVSGRSVVGFFQTNLKFVILLTELFRFRERFMFVSSIDLFFSFRFLLTIFTFHPSGLLALSDIMCRPIDKCAATEELYVYAATAVCNLGGMALTFWTIVATTHY